MPTVIRDLMSTPPVQADGDDTLASVARRMADANIGSVIIAEGADVVGIVTERDLLRAAAVDRDPATEPARRWMTASPDVLGPEEEADVAWYEPVPPSLPPPARWWPAGTWSAWSRSAT